MGIIYRLDVLAALKDAGYTTYRLRKEKLLPEGTIQHLRDGAGINFDSLAVICQLLAKQPGDILKYVPDGE